MVAEDNGASAGEGNDGNGVEREGEGEGANGFLRERRGILRQLEADQLGAGKALRGDFAILPEFCFSRQDGGEEAVGLNGDFRAAGGGEGRENAAGGNIEKDQSTAGIGTACIGNEELGRAAVGESAEAVGEGGAEVSIRSG